MSEVQQQLTVFEWTSVDGNWNFASTARFGGVSDGSYSSLNVARNVGDHEQAVVENRRRICDATAGFKRSISALNQVHGADIVAASACSPWVSGNGGDLPGGAPPEADGVLLHAGEAGVVQTADCVPLALIGTGGGAVVIHAGWRGTAAGIVSAGLEQLGNLSAAIIGPSIRQCCYEVSVDVIDDLGLDLADSEHVHRSLRHGHYMLDLAAVIADQVRHAAPNAHIEDSNMCTCCDARFFSYRREGSRVGRQATVVWSVN